MFIYSRFRCGVASVFSHKWAFCSRGVNLFSSCFRLLLVAFGCFGLLPAASGCFDFWEPSKNDHFLSKLCIKTILRIDLGGPGCFWLLLAAPGCSWLLLAASGCFWLLLAASGCFWLFLTASGCFGSRDTCFHSETLLSMSSGARVFVAPITDLLI